jgi:uncharacterized Zn finger protein
MSELTLNGKSAAKSWWAGHWMQALARWFDPERMTRGSNLARQGRVTDLTVQVGLAQAHVQGIDGSEQEVRISVRAFADEHWQRAITVLAGQALYTAQLLNGELPHEIDTVFRAAGVSLFPRSANELSTTCTCSDWGHPCTHVVATLHRLGEMLDVDPFTILVLRGRSREQVMADLRAERAERLGSGDTADHTHDVAEQAPPLIADPEAFWELGAALSDLQIRVRRPEIEMELVRILGTPEFANHPELEKQLEEVYARVTARALRVAYEGEGQD